MAISNDQLQHWIESVAEVEGLLMDADKMVEDIVFIATVFDQEEIFDLTMTNTIKAFKLIIRDRNIGDQLVGNKAGWNSFHYQSRIVRKLKADMRIVYRDTGTDIQIMGFGHRWYPQDIYDRLSSGRP